MLFGAHVSVSGGYIAALDYAQSVGCECMQIFAKSPRQWYGKELDPAAVRRFAEAREHHGMGPVFTHTAYLINLATTDDDLRHKSVRALADELIRGATLSAAGVVTHLGNDPGDDPAAAAVRVGQSIVAAYDIAGSAGESARLLLENTAGAGRTFGSTFGQLHDCIAEADLAPERLGICVDTCHLFAQGGELDTEAGWRTQITELAATVGLDRLGLIHANDCKFERGTHKDRHEWIGQGFIGIEGFRAMVCAPELAGMPVVTEMPGEVPEKDAVNNATLVALRDGCEASQ